MEVLNLGLRLLDGLGRRRVVGEDIGLVHDRLGRGLQQRGHIHRLYAAILGDGLAGKKNGRVVLRARIAFTRAGAITGTAARLTRFARTTVTATIAVAASTASTVVTVTTSVALTTIATRALGIGSRLVLVAGFAAGFAAIGVAARCASFAATVLGDGLAGENSGGGSGGSCRRLAGLRLKIVFVIALGGDGIGVLQVAGNAVLGQASRLKATQLAARSGRRGSIGVFLLFASGLCSGCGGRGLTGLAILAFAVLALTTSTAATAAAAATPARSAIACFAICGIAFGRGCGRLFALGFRVRIVFVIGIGAGLRRGHNEAVGIRQRRAGDFYIAEFAVFVLVLQVEEVGDVEEGVALEADIHEGRLHAGQNARDAALVDGAGQSVFVFPLEIDFGELVVFDQCHLGFMRRGGNVKFLVHVRSRPALTEQAE